MPPPPATASHDAGLRCGTPSVDDTSKHVFQVVQEVPAGAGQGQVLGADQIEIKPKLRSIDRLGYESALFHLIPYRDAGNYGCPIGVANEFQGSEHSIDFHDPARLGVPQPHRWGFDHLAQALPPHMKNQLQFLDLARTAPPRVSSLPSLP